MSEITQLQQPEQQFSPEQALPPLEAGFVRLYRGDVVDPNGNPFAEEMVGRSTNHDIGGRWFTDNPNAAEGYAASRQHDVAKRTPETLAVARTRFVDVPVEVAEQHNGIAKTDEGSRGAADEWLLPQEFADAAAEYHVKTTDQQYPEGVEAGLLEILSNPELTGLLGEMGVTADRIHDIIADPHQVIEVLDGISRHALSGEVPVSDKASLEESLRALHRGVESAYKYRYVGGAPPQEATPAQADAATPNSIW